MNTEDLHDSQVVKIEHMSDSKLLKLGLITDQGIAHDLIFQEVVGWIFTPFEFQNVLFDVKIYKFEEVPNSVWNEWDGVEAYAALAKKWRSNVAVLSPSVGLGGVVLFIGSHFLNES